MPRPNRHEQQSRVYTWLGLALLVLAPGVVWLVWREEIQTLLNNRHLAQAFQGHETILFEKADAIARAGGGYGKEAPEPRRRGGKAAWVNVRTIPHSNRLPDYIPSLDPDFGRLPDEMRAASPAEAETIVLLFSKAARVGHYVPESSAGAPAPRFPGVVPAGALDAWMEYLDAHVVDAKGGQYLGRKRFEWHPKGRVDLTRESHIQERNSKELLDWYMALPEK